MKYYITSPNQLSKFYSWIQSQVEVGLDTEGTSLSAVDNELLLVQIGNYDTQFIFDVARLGKDTVKKVVETVDSNVKTIVMHNAKYDYSVIKAGLGYEIEKIACTLLQGQLFYAGWINAGLSYGELIERFIGVRLAKDEGKNFISHVYGADFTENQIQYAADDVKYLVPLYHKLKEKLEERGQGYLMTVEFRTVAVSGDMEVAGIKVDTEKWLSLSTRAFAELEKVSRKLDEHFKPYIDRIDLWGRPIINYKSVQQVQPILEKILKQPLPSTGTPVLEGIDHEAAELMIEFRTWAKLADSYGTDYLRKHINKKTGRIHATFKQLGAASGRYTCSDPNLQQIPGEDVYREPFIPEDGYKFVCADFSGQELRLLAHISQEPAMVQALNENKDLHSYSASLLFNIPYEKFFEYDEKNNVKLDNAGDPIVKKEMKAKYRNPAKSITFGLIYGMGPKKLSRELKITFDAAKDLFNKYFEVFPKVKELMNKLTVELHKNHYLSSPLDGRRRELPGLDWNDPKKVAHAVNQAKNLPFQGAGATVTKLAMCLIKHEIKQKKLDATIVASIHDEVIVEVLESQANIVAEIVKTAMIRAFNFYAPSVPMAVNPKIGNHWIH